MENDVSHLWKEGCNRNFCMVAKFVCSVFFMMGMIGWGEDSFMESLSIFSFIMFFAFGGLFDERLRFRFVYIAFLFASYRLSRTGDIWFATMFIAGVIIHATRRFMEIDKCIYSDIVEKLNKKS